MSLGSTEVRVARHFLSDLFEYYDPGLFGNYRRGGVDLLGSGPGNRDSEDAPVKRTITSPLRLKCHKSMGLVMWAGFCDGALLNYRHPFKSNTVCL